LPGLARGYGAVPRELAAQWSHGAGDQDRLFDCFPGEADSSPIDRLDLRRQAELRELQPIGAKRVGLHEIDPRLGIAAVDLLDETRIAQVQLVEATVQEDSMLVQRCPHRAVAEQDLL